MAFDVRLHGFLGVESVIADSALVYLFAVVGHLVELEDVIVSEGFAAYFAGIRFFTCVGAGVDLQLFAAGETFLTHLADIRFFAWNSMNCLKGC